MAVTAPALSASAPTTLTSARCAPAVHTLTQQQLSEARASYARSRLGPSFFAQAAVALGVPCTLAEPDFEPALAEHIAAFQQRMSRFRNECSGALDARTLRHLRMLFPSLRPADDPCAHPTDDAPEPLPHAVAARVAERNRELGAYTPSQLRALQHALGASPAAATGAMDESTVQRIARFQADVKRARPDVRRTGALDAATWDALARAYPQLEKNGGAASAYLPACLLRWDRATGEQVRLMRRVYEIQRVRAAQKRSFVLAVDDATEIDEGRWAPAEVADWARRMLAAARESRGTPRVAGRESLRIVFGYRSAPVQLEVWEHHFAAREKEGRERRGRLAGGAYGEAAARVFADGYAGRTASPGYSLHNQGHALDLMCVLRDGRELGADSKTIPAWKRSWCWKWLRAHAAGFGFRGNRSIDEPWHWEFIGGGPMAQAR
ncbi:MAG: M15 family metallopeptidase [Polyangiaceae bacterium]|nr:M15 family metallopeptidase [Polyangiaceae bacterium]